MKVEVLFFGRPRELAGISREVLSLKAGMRLSNMLERLAKRHGDDLKTELSNLENLIILVNGRHYTTLNGIDTVLSDEDTVAILPVIFGG
jgi:molybdopterin converting factor small subunit